MKLVFCLFSLAWYTCSGQDYSLVRDSSAIYWCEKRKLLWSDFKNVPDTSQDIKARAHVSIPIEIIMSSTKGLTYKVFAIFERDSWTSTDDYNCLHHEQLHFDITELYARKIRYLINLNKKASKAQILKITNKMIIEFHETQSQYDADTSHGISLERQQKWRDSINLELKKLNSFASKHNCP